MNKKNKYIRQCTREQKDSSSIDGFSIGQNNMTIIWTLKIAIIHGIVAFHFYINLEYKSISWN